MGWTGGYCLVALFLAPYLRKFGQFTIPDFLGERYGGNIVRTIGIIVGDHVLVRLRRRADLRRRPDHQPVHRPRVRRRRVRRPRRHPRLLDARRHEGGDLDAGRAVHHPDHRLPDAGGLARASSTPAFRFRSSPTATRCRRSTELEKKITNDPKEQEVRKTFADRAAAGKAALADPDKAFAEGKAKVEKDLADLKAANAPADKIAAAEKAVAAYPKDVSCGEVGLDSRGRPGRPIGGPAAARGAVRRQGRGGARHGAARTSSASCSA